jgi:hypothetical protein
LIALQLDDLAQFFVGDQGAIASKVFFEGFQQLLGVIFRGQALDGRQRLSAVTLLDSDVHVVRRFGRGLSCGELIVTNIGEGI